jgi:hypothetical protein
MQMTSTDKKIAKVSYELGEYSRYEQAAESKERLIQGTLVKFNNTAQWNTKDDAELPADLELLVVNILRVVQKWQDQIPVETIVLPTHKNLNIDKMNEAVPHKEWVKGPDGKLRGPWQRQFLMYLLDPKTMTRFTWATGTIGGGIAVRELEQRIGDKALFLEADVKPIVKLSDCHFPTQFGDRRRPHLIVTGWKEMGGEGVAAKPLLPAPDEGAEEDIEEDIEDSPWEETAPREEKAGYVKHVKLSKRGVQKIEDRKRRAKGFAHDSDLNDDLDNI